MGTGFHITLSSFHYENLCFQDAVALVLPVTSQGPSKVSKMPNFLSWVVGIWVYILLLFFKLYMSSYIDYLYMWYIS